MTTQFTPGPWFVITKNTMFMVDSEKTRKSYNGRVADIPQFSYEIAGPMRDEAGANARLIAAAPELFTLLREARRTFEMWKDVAPAVSLCIDIDAAIAKATGAAS